MNLLTRHFTIAAIGLAAAALTGCNYGLMGASASMAGPQLYRSCVNCHGPAGAGRADVGAPRIAGLPQWYLASQLHRFQDGLRGKHPDDYDGLRMRAMSQQMRSAAEIDAIAAYVSSLPAETNPASPKGGSAAAGQPTFVICANCHGQHGEGNQQVGAPPIAGLDDWYIARQLRKFQAGVRGKAAGDPVGPIMQAVSLAVDPAAIDNVAAYVHGLPRP